MDNSFWIYSGLMGFLAPILVQVFKGNQSKLNFWFKLLLAFGISGLVGVGNAALNGAFKDGIVDYTTLTASVGAVIAFGQAFWKTTFESYFTGK